MAFSMLFAIVVSLMTSVDFAVAKRSTASDLPDWSAIPSFQRLSRAQLEFSMDLYKTLTADIANTTLENVVLSPYSVMSVLSMLYLGSSGATSDQLRHTLHYDNLSYVEVHRSYKKIVEGFRHGKFQANLTLANKIFVQENVNVSKVYEEKLLEYYDASLELVDFANNASFARDLINAWARVHTRGKITQLVSGLPNPSTKILLANAVHYRGFWLYAFDRTKTVDGGLFRIGASDTATVPMMVARLRVPHGHSDALRCSVLELPYVDRRLSMLILLPDDSTDLRDLDSRLTADAVTQALSDLRDDVVNVRLPRFGTESSLRLRETLMKLGLVNLFIENQADLSGLTSGVSDVHVNDLTHRTSLTITEEGSEVSATTALDVERIGFVGESYFEVDRPFLFFIWDYQINTFLFIGRITRPQAA